MAAVDVISTPLFIVYVTPVLKEPVKVPSLLASVKSVAQLILDKLQSNVLAKSVTESVPVLSM